MTLIFCEIAKLVIDTYSYKHANSHNCLIHEGYSIQAEDYHTNIRCMPHVIERWEKTQRLTHTGKRY
jgi:hypothetical protein